MGVDGVNCLYLDGEERLWVGTDGRGLDCLDVNGERFSHFTTEQGLSSNVVRGILEDEDKNLWLCTDIGVSRFNPKTGQFRFY